MREIEHKDYFGNLIEMGNEVLVPRYSEIEKFTIGKITPGGIYLNTTKKVAVNEKEQRESGYKIPLVWEIVPHLLRKEAKWFAEQIIVLNKITVKKDD